ncbi:AAA domain containing protein [Amanita muscaria]
MENQEIRVPKAIYVVGPSSTGKSTLCTALAKKLNLRETAYVTEVARAVLREKGYPRKDVHRLQIQQEIMLAHLQKEQQARNETQDIILCDRSAVDPIVYAILTSKDEQDGIERRDKFIQLDEFQNILPLYQQSLFILLESVEEWLVDDGVRSIENQKECFEVFQIILQHLGIKYRVMGSNLKPLEERVETMMRWGGLV